MNFSGFGLRLRTAWDALVNGRVAYNVPVIVNVKIERGGICLQDLYDIQEYVHAGVWKALEEYRRGEN